MILRELYPYWSDTHQELIEKLEILDEDQWDAKPCHRDAGSIRQIAIRLIRHERHWIEEIAQKRDYEELPSSDLLSGLEIISELNGTRAATLRYLESLTQDGLRAVRTAPGDPATNEFERNVTLSWVFWNVMEYELMSWGQIQLRLSE